MTEPTDKTETAVKNDSEYEAPALSPLGSVHAQTLVTNPPT